MTELEKQLMVQVERLTIQNEKQAQQIQELIHQLTTMNRRMFGVSSEQTPSDQLSLFEDESSFKEPEPTEEKAVEMETVSYQRKKFKGQRAFLTKDLPIIEENHELPCHEQVCLCCASTLHSLGRKEVRTELEFIPAHLILHKHYEHAYECLNCKKQGQNQIRRQKAPVPALQKSLAGPSVLAWNLYQKLEMGLPYHRQEKEWQRYGLAISRRTLSNWSIRICEEWLSLIYEAMRQTLVTEQVLSADETVYQILHREDGKPSTSDARIWVFRTSEKAVHPIILYHSSETRKYEVAESFLKGFKGFLHCDGYSAYKKLPEVQLQLCWAHVRRKFFETNDPYGKGAVGVDFCNQLFHLEALWKDLPAEKRLKKRQEHSAPVVSEFWSWLEELETMKGGLQKAVTYAMNHKESLNTFLTNGELSLSNNLAERSIRPVTVGRKNWYFSASVAGAKANTLGYSLIQTAKENGLEPYAYLTWVLKELPQVDILRHPDRIRAYLPWSPESQKAVPALKKAN